MATPISPDSAARPVEGLTLGPALVLPVEAVTETFAIMAKRGAGKTYTAAALVEEMMGAAARRFMTDFAERLYHRNRDPRHHHTVR